MKQEPTKKVGIYARVSTDEQVNFGNSLEAQIEKLEQYCKLNGWQIVKKYTDAGISGATIDRPELKQMILDAGAGHINAILVYKLDRLSRSLRDIILTIDELREYNTDFVSITEQIDTTTAVGRLMFHIIGAFAEFERGMICERVILGQDKKAKNGYAQQKAPFGYSFRGGELTTNKDEVIIIKAVQKAYLEKKSTLNVSREFGLPRSLIYQILTNETYLGKVKWKGELIDGRHEALLDIATYKRIRRIMNKKKKR